MRWNFYLVTLASLLAFVGCGNAPDNPKPYTPPSLKNYYTDKEIEKALLDGSCDGQLAKIPEGSALELKPHMKLNLISSELFVATRVDGYKAQALVSTERAAPLCTSGGLASGDEAFSARNRQVASEEIWSQFEINADGIIVIKELLDLSATFSHKDVTVGRQLKALEQPRNQPSLLKELMGYLDDGGESHIVNRHIPLDDGKVMVVTEKWWRSMNSASIRYSRITSIYSVQN